MVVDIADRLCRNHINKMLDVADRPNHVEVNAEFGADVSLAGAYVSRNESETRRRETCTQFVDERGDNGLVVTHRPGTTFGLVTMEYTGEQVEPPCSPRAIANCVITLS